MRRSAGSVAGQEVRSPHARGWSLSLRGEPGVGVALPARAGMVPGAVVGGRRGRGAPRTRGDGPYACQSAARDVLCSPHARGWSAAVDEWRHTLIVLPARAGMVPHWCGAWSVAPCAPRTRGDGPIAAQSKSAGYRCSPHARGWSRDLGIAATRAPVLPARAGMVRHARAVVRPGRGAPRTRGDGPWEHRSRCLSQVCSPHARGRSLLGWDLGEGVAVLPARAGAARVDAAPGPGRSGAPRTRGGGPHRPGCCGPPGQCSPHARG